MGMGRYLSVHYPLSTNPASDGGTRSDVEFDFGMNRISAEYLFAAGGLASDCRMGIIYTSTANDQEDQWAIVKMQQLMDSK